MINREETAADQAAVRVVNLAAFPTPAEANLVASLRHQVHPVISLVAESVGEIVGHILFSPVTLDGHPDAVMMGLAPMAVVPNHQRQGIGSALVQAGLAACKTIHVGAVIVLGHPGYYPRFGFSPAREFSISSEYAAPANVFMALEIQSGYLSSRSGKARYHEAFKSVKPNNKRVSQPCPNRKTK